MKKILFPTDCSAGARQGFAYACEFARQTGAKIEVMSVYHLPAADASSVPPAYIETMIEERRKQVEQNLAAFVAEFPEAPILGTHADYGIFTHQEIVDVAAKGGHDLIIMGTRGAANTMDKLLGSVTTHTMMQAPCPVLAIPAQAQWAGIRHIAYATDFQPSDVHAVAQLAQLAQTLDAQLHFVHIHTASHDDISIEAMTSLEHYPTAFTDFTIVRHPSVMEGLEGYLQEYNIDLLALFIPRRRIWERLFHSSFSRQMVFHTRLPLLTFRA